MRAVVQHTYGGTEVLRVEQRADPTAGPGEVLVEVRAAGVDRGTWHLMTGLPYVARPVIGLRAPKVPVLGRDLAGVVLAVGDGVTRVAVGDEVIGTADGSFAERAVVPEKRIARKPTSLGFAESAVLAISGLTALQAVRDSGRVRAGQQVLVIGASGGVGSYAVQIARALGAQVTGVASAHKADLVRSLGAVDVIDYAAEEIDARGPRFEVIIDLGGNRPLRLLRRALVADGTLVVAGGEGGGSWTGGTHRQLAAMVLSPFVKQRLTGMLSSENGTDMDELVRLVEEGTLRPVLERTFPLEDAAKAIDHVASGHARGKVALSI